MKKRSIALILILTMLWSSGLDILPGLCLAYAESNQESREDTRALKKERFSSRKALLFQLCCKIRHFNIQESSVCP